MHLAYSRARRSDDTCILSHLLRPQDKATLPSEKRGSGPMSISYLVRAGLRPPEQSPYIKARYLLPCPGVHAGHREAVRHPQLPLCPTMAGAAVVSVANLTRHDSLEFFSLASKIGIVTHQLPLEPGQHRARRRARRPLRQFCCANAEANL